MRSINVRELTLQAIIDDCQRETELFIRTGIGETAYCYELWRRAIVLKDPDASNAVVEQYWEPVQKQVHKGLTDSQATRSYADRKTIVHECVNDAFSRFWGSFTPTKFYFSHSLQEVLVYLSKCAKSSVDQWIRDYYHLLAREDDDVEDLDDIPVSKDWELQNQEENIVKARLCLSRNCADEVDRRLVHCVAIEGIRLEQAFVELRQFFPERKQLYQRWRTFKERVARDEECRQVLLDWDT